MYQQTPKCLTDVLMPQEDPKTYGVYRCPQGPHGIWGTYDIWRTYRYAGVYGGIHMYGGIQRYGGVWVPPKLTTPIPASNVGKHPI